MYFDEAPKTAKQDIFNYSDEFQKLLSSLSDKRRMIIIKGRRRVGKTSLLLSCLNEFDRPYIVLDSRAFSSYPQVRREEFIKLLENCLNGFLQKNKRLGVKIVDALKHVDGLQPGTAGIPAVSLRWGPTPRDTVNVTSLFDVLSEEAAKQKTTFVVAMDEAQEFKKIMRYDLTSILAHAYDYCRGLQFVITGSEMGMLEKFLRVNDDNAPLFGRAMIEIELKGLTKEQSIKYLHEGFEQVKLKVPDEMIESIHSRFDGIIGWLTYAGVKAREEKKINQRIMEAVAVKASKVVAREFKNFLQLYKSERYRIIMRNLARGSSTWADLKRAVESKAGVTIVPSEITKLLYNLENAGFVSKADDGTYFIPDPMAIEAAAKGLI